MPITIAGSGRLFALPQNMTVPEALEITAFLIDQVRGATAQAAREQKGTELATPQGPHLVKVQ